MTPQLVQKSNIMMSRKAFSKMRNNLEANIGVEKTKGFLFRFGKELGEEAAENNFDQENQARKEEKVHILFGHVQDVHLSGRIIKQSDGSIYCDNTVGKWIQSFEGLAYLKEKGVATEPVCHTLCGFASGALSYDYKVPLIAIESKCIAMGHDCCEFEVRLLEDWMDEQQELLKLYLDDNIMLELELTYDELMKHKQTLENLSTFQSHLTQKVKERYSLKELIQEAYDVIQIPIILEDLYGELIHVAGATDEQVQALLVREQKVATVKDDIFELFKGPHHIRICAPILITQRSYAKCSFIYFDQQQVSDTDKMFLDKIANILALRLLYEEAQFEENQRMRNSIIERLIHQQSVESIDNMLKFLPFKFKPPFHTMLLKAQATNSTVDYYQMLVRYTKLFEVWNIPAVLAVIGEEIIIVVGDSNVPLSQVLKVCETNLLKEVEKQFNFNIGVSQPYEQLQQFQISLKQARIAHRLYTKKVLTTYDELGHFGHILVNIDRNEMHVLAVDTLKKLYDLNNPKKKELLYTLYIYLLHNQRIKETMEFLNLSVGGIQYRIRKAEEYLGASLKDAKLSSLILMILSALVLYGDLDFDVI